MPNLTTHRLLAEALSAAKAASHDGILKGNDLERATRERLKSVGYITEILRGWYLLAQPEGIGTSTLWYGSFWHFLRYYLSDRFGDRGYYLSPESSVDLYTGDSVISNQVIVFTKKASNQKYNLPFNTSLFLYADRLFPSELAQKDGIAALPLSDAIMRLSPSYYLNKPDNVEIALKAVSPVELSRSLLKAQSVASVERVTGALIAIKEEETAKKILDDYAAAGAKVKPQNPFSKPPLLLSLNFSSPYTGRIESLWKTLRPQVMDNFFELPQRDTSIAIIEQIYSEDAYHSLSIEGYHVTEDLIKKIAEGAWNPANNEKDRKQTDAMAAKGYLNCFKTVLESLKKVSRPTNAGQVFQEDLPTWYRELFSPSVQAGIVAASDLAGYRNGPVFIKGSRHVPPSKDAVPSAMETLFGLLGGESDARVRAVLGHFIFGYIHPYFDGNGRIARFLMNLMLFSGGYNWTVIRVEKRSEYMAALERTSTDKDIRDFTKIINEEMRYWKTFIENKKARGKNNET